AHIVQLRQSKKDAEARTYAFDIFARRYGETAEKMRGPWSRTLKNFGAAWDSFVNAVNGIDFGAANAKIRSLMGLIERLSAMLPDASARTVAHAEQAISRKEAEAARLEGIVARNRGRPDPRGYISGFAQRAQQLRSEVLYLRGRIEVLEAQDNGG